MVVEVMAFHYFFFEVVDVWLTHVGDLVELKKIVRTQRRLLVGELHAVAFLV